MRTDIQTKIDDLLANGYNVNFNDLFNKTLETYKGIWLMGGLGVLVIGIASWLINQLFALVFGVGSMAMFDPVDMQDPDSARDAILQMYTSATMIGFMLVSALVGLVFLPAYAGIIKMAHDYDHGKAVDFGSLLEYYKTPYFGKILLGGLLYTLLIWVGFSLCLIPGVYLLVAMVIYVPFIIFGGLDPWQAIVSSIKIISKNWLVFFLVGLVTGLLTLLGVFACIIGIAFTYPLMFAFIYNSYKETVGFDDLDNEINQIGEANNPYLS